MTQPRPSQAWLLVLAGGVALPPGCAHEPASLAGPRLGTVLHLEDELPRARVECAPADASRAERAWSFDQPRPEWRTLRSTLEQAPDAARVTLAREDGFRGGGIVTDVPESRLADWDGLVVRVRSHGRLAGIAAVCNVDDEGALPGMFAFFTGDGSAPVFNDGSVQSYSLPFARAEGETLRSIGVFAAAPGPASFDVLSVRLVPRGAGLAEDVGVTSLERDGVTRRTLYAHVPAKLSWSVRVPAGGRLDLGLACLPGETLDVRAALRSGTGPEEVLLEAHVADSEVWQQHALDLARHAGKEVELVLAATGSEPGAVALFGAPILSGEVAAAQRRPDVVFYVIDGGGADFMSLYGYDRRTTPFLERLAEEGVVFEQAHSNSTWTQPSTASFMTSLHHSVLGGLRRGIHSTPVPAGATTMAEHMRRAGYQTAVFTTNPNCARVIGLERGVDYMRDVEEGPHSTSSSELHERYFAFREAYPGEPCWVHFQTTDVHEPNEPVPPFAGQYVSQDEQARLEEWDGQLYEKGGELWGRVGITEFYDKAIVAAGIDRKAYFDTRRGLYDETMGYQDQELGRFVARLKASGEWEHTLLVIGADHGHPAGTFARFGHGLLEPQPEGWQGALFDAFATRVPLIFVWPGKIPGGRRIEQPVSMIDVLPTLLDLLDLPAPEVVQGRSLAPLLLGGELEQRPVILDEFRVDEASGEVIGNIELIDGRFGASLQIGPGSLGTGGRHAVPAGGRWGAVHSFYPEVPRLLLYDLARDPFATHAVNDEHPELVERYREELLHHWQLHQALATRFTEASDRPMTPEQLNQLQALGYVR
jgi:arylsulfatase A-like enzyme